MDTKYRMIKPHEKEAVERGELEPTCATIEWDRRVDIEDQDGTKIMTAGPSREKYTKYSSYSDEQLAANGLEIPKEWSELKGWNEPKEKPPIEFAWSWHSYAWGFISGSVLVAFLAAVR